QADDDGPLGPLLGLLGVVLGGCVVPHLQRRVHLGGVEDGRDRQRPEEEDGQDRHPHVVVDLLRPLSWGGPRRWRWLHRLLLFRRVVSVYPNQGMLPKRFKRRVASGRTAHQYDHRYRAGSPESVEFPGDPPPRCPGVWYGQQSAGPARRVP